MANDLSPELVSQLISNLSLSQIFSPDFIPAMAPVVTFLVMISIYGILIWHFYRFIARRDIFFIDAKKFKYEGAFGKLFDIVWYLFKYTIIYPIFTFIFFFGYASMLIFLSKNLDTGAILVTSISLISAIRISAYYNEDLAKDLAKMFPFAILAIFLLDPSFFSIEQVIARFLELPNFFLLGLRFMVFVILLEWVLRIIYSIYAAFKIGGQKRVDQKLETEAVQLKEVEG